MDKTFEIVIDTKSDKIKTISGIKQGDDVQFDITLTEDGKHIIFGSVNIIEAVVSIPAGGLQETVVLTEEIVEFIPFGARIRLKLPKRFTEEAGLYKFELTYYYGGGGVTCGRLYYNVSERLGDIDAPTDDDIVTYRQMMEKTSEAVEVASDLEEAEAGRVQNENERIGSEKLREDAEDERAAAEQDRVAAEKLRVDAENARVTAERERKTGEIERISAENERIIAESARVAAEEQRTLDLSDLDERKLEMSSVSAADEKITVEAEENTVEIGHAPLTAVPGGEYEYWVSTQANRRYGESPCDDGGEIFGDVINIPVISFDSSGHINQAGQLYIPIAKLMTEMDYNDPAAGDYKLASAGLVSRLRNSLRVNETYHEIEIPVGKIMKDIHFLDNGITALYAGTDSLTLYLYNKGDDVSAITSEDTVNTAIAKLERRTDDIPIVDKKLNEQSFNAVSNNAVSEKFLDTDTKINNLEVTLNWVDGLITIHDNDIADLFERVDTLDTKIGDTDAALDSILAIQNSLIGGASE